MTMELSPMIIGTVVFLLLFMTLRRPSQSTERIYVPIDVPVREKFGCMPLLAAITLFLLLAALLHG
jgi:hypothetical protein